MNAGKCSRRGVLALGFLAGSLTMMGTAHAQPPPLPQTQMSWVSVTAHGANPANDGGDDTIALQTAINVAASHAMGITPVNGAGVRGADMATLPVVYFPRGHYRIRSKLIMPSSISLISDEKAIIEQTEHDEILHFGSGYSVWIRGLKFIGGTHQIYFSNANVDSTMIDIYECEFQLSSDYAIYTIGDGSQPDDHLSANLTINKSKFIKVNKVLFNACDNALLKDSWVWVAAPGSVGGGNFSQDSAAFYNYGYNLGSLLHLGGVLRFDNMFGVPTMGAPGAGRAVKARWVDLHGGSFYAQNARFGGEDGGMPIVYSFVDTRNQGYPFLGNVVSIEHSTVATGPSAQPDSSVVYLETGVPQLIRVVGNEGVVDVPYVKAGFSLSNHFDNVSNAQQRYKLEIEPNLTSSATTAPRVPMELRRFLQPTKSSPFPLGSQRAIDLGSPPSAAKYTYTIPTEVATFTAIVTVSANPILEAYAPYRSSVSYFVSLVTGYNYGANPPAVYDYLLTASPFQAPAPNVSFPLNVSIYFEGTGAAQRPHSVGGDFTVRVDNGSPAYHLWPGQTFVSLEVLNIGY